MRVYVCDNNIESIFTGIHLAWESRIGHSNIKILVKTLKYDNYNTELFCDYMNVITDRCKAESVMKSIKSKISIEAYHMICNVIRTESIDKGDLIYRFLIMGFHIGPKVVDYLTYDAVRKVLDLSRRVDKERHHYLGFIRFAEGSNGILISKISPDNDLLLSLADHFSERLSTENFIIFDTKRNSAIIHRSCHSYIYTQFEGDEFYTWSDERYVEEEYTTLWKIFYQTISIKERENYKLQRNNLPLKYRKNMTEFVG